MQREAPALLPPVPAKVWWLKWVADIQPVGSGEAALKYLANYLVKPPLHDTEIERWDAQGVTFRYRENDGAVQRVTVRGGEDEARTHCRTAGLDGARAGETRAAAAAEVRVLREADGADRDAAPRADVTGDE